VAAIASELAAEAFGLNILHRNIQVSLFLSVSLHTQTCTQSLPFRFLLLLASVSEEPGQDSDANETRFLVLGTLPCARSGDDRTLLRFTPPSPESLSRALSAFAAHSTAPLSPSPSLYCSFLKRI
jgi:prephenate dehydratase